MKVNGPKSGSLYATLTGNSRHLFARPHKAKTSGLPALTSFEITCPTSEMVTPVGSNQNVCPQQVLFPRTTAPAMFARLSVCSKCNWGRRSISWKFWYSRSALSFVKPFWFWFRSLIVRATYVLFSLIDFYLSRYGVLQVHTCSNVLVEVILLILMFCILLWIVDIKCAGEPTTQLYISILVLILVKKTQGLYHSVSTLQHTQTAQ
jgi:hypothetical protein